MRISSLLGVLMLRLWELLLGLFVFDGLVALVVALAWLSGADMEGWRSGLALMCLMVLFVVSYPVAGAIMALAGWTAWWLSRCARRAD